MSEKLPRVLVSDDSGWPLPIAVVFQRLFRDHPNAFQILEISQDRDILQDKHVLLAKLYISFTNDQLLALSRGERIELGIDATAITPPSADDEEDDEKDL